MDSNADTNGYSEINVPQDHHDLSKTALDQGDSTTQEPNDPANITNITPNEKMQYENFNSDDNVNEISNNNNSIKLDCLYALKLHLQDTGAGEVQIEQLKTCLEDGSFTNAFIIDHSFAHSLQSAFDTITQDYNLSRHIAMMQIGVRNHFINNTAYQPHRLEDYTRPQSQLPNQSDPQNNEPLTKSSECIICFELFDTVVMFDAGSCNHKYCNSCIVKYFDNVVRENKPYPVKCPACDVVIENDSILGLLSGTGQLFHTFERFIINQEHMKRVRYCSNEKCGVPFDWRLDGAGSANGEMKEEDIRVICPCCTKQTCANCRSRWHEGQTCEEYKNVLENVTLNWMARGKELWTNCPNCGHLIEKQTGDCNYMLCICGCSFCHLCGTRYISVEETAQNMHGEPGCSCLLFENDEEEILEEEDDAALHENHAIMPFGMYQPNFVEGPNGRIDVWACVIGVHDRIGAALPQPMLDDLADLRCPYRRCRRLFNSARLLGQHLAFVEEHNSYLCCDRPFYTLASKMNHMMFNHTNQTFEERLGWI